MSIKWGLLGPVTLSSQRRTRTLGLGATVRLFNEKAVPGLGGLWFAKPLLLALLGIRVAERLRDEGRSLSNIQAANAVEALACWLAFTKNDWKPDARLQGINTLPRDIEELTFKKAAQRSFYVTQPMRLGTVQALPALGLVSQKNSRFNSYSCKESSPFDSEKSLGETFIEEATAKFRPNKLSVLEFLTQWARGDRQATGTQQKLRKALSPLEPLPEEARYLLRDRLRQGDGGERRKNILAWAEEIRRGRRCPAWDSRPACIDEEHWRDLKAGAYFFALQDAANTALESMENYIARLKKTCLSLDEKLPEEVKNTLNTLREKASDCQKLGEYDGLERAEANAFIGECLQADPCLRASSLVKRDGRVLYLDGNAVCPGPAFDWDKGIKESANDGNAVRPDPASDASLPDPGDENEEDTLFPPNISFRVNNLYRLHLDLQGELDQYLHPEEGK